MESSLALRSSPSSMNLIFSAASSIVVMVKESEESESKADSGGVISSDASTSSKNQHGEFTLTQIMTIIDESNLFCRIFQRSLG